MSSFALRAGSRPSKRFGSGLPVRRTNAPPSGAAWRSRTSWYCHGRFVRSTASGACVTVERAGYAATIQSDEVETPAQLLEGGAERGMQPQRRLRVASTGASGDDGDRDAVAGGPSHEPVTTHHGQRRAEDEQRVSAVDDVEAPTDRVLGHRLAEEDDVGLEGVGAADEAHRQVEASGHRVVEDDVAVRADLAGDPGPVGSDAEDQVDEAGVGLGQPLVQRSALDVVAAGEADDPVEVAVQLGHVDGTGGLVEAIDVLGDDGVEQAGPLEGRDRPMSAVRRRAVEPLPADVAAGPVAPAGLA